ncbi:phosphoribosyl-ATP pyrophosphatase [Clostridium cavendishii DSM 21758]|uniref:Phosphoribosyl-ATP pyrophosphatase n=1 Tax=Clostridium cavendishii DSM 21758 TaxID=1121302 RepID=A0A1M6F2F6_9CLOT|nr:phosphoribosyl-ATP diphosphatase [Clostridium cavendishii]SHI91851.1 phosphoribosyl-ATP pyrophosphatase [Clostridium cavendishii DSM 21758]
MDRKIENSIVDLYNLIALRKEEDYENSYTNYLFKQGLDKILKKIGEESTEVIISAKGNNNYEVIKEVCDLIYHLLVLLNSKNISLIEIQDELMKRKSKMGNLKAERKEIEVL